MKQSTIYRRAAEFIADRLEVGEFVGCCRAIKCVSSNPRTGVCDDLDELAAAKITLGELLGVNTPDPSDYWWPVDDELNIDREAQNARMIGLLLAVELLTGGAS